MGVCKYCGARIIRLSATKCKKCFDEVFRYTESYTWFRFTEMCKEDYFHELISMAVTPTMQKHFDLESGGRLNSLELNVDETVLLAIKNVSYVKEALLKDSSIGRIKSDTGCLVLTNKRLVYLGRILRINKEYVSILSIEEHNELGIKIPQNFNLENRTVKLYQYFSPCVEEIYYIQKVWEYVVAGRNILEGMEKHETSGCHNRYRVKKQASIREVRKNSKDEKEAV